MTYRAAGPVAGSVPVPGPVPGPVSYALSLALRARTSAQQRGFTLFELFLVILIFSILIAALLDKAFDNLEIGEKSAMESQRMTMRVGLDMHIAGLITAGREKDLVSLRGGNPVEWLSEPPVNYLGAFVSDPGPAGGDGGWYFDTTAREIVYIPKRHRHLNPGRDGQYRVRFQVVAGGLNDRANDAGPWPILAPVEPYVWFKSGHLSK